MVGIVIASHGDFASGIFQSGQMILGEQENVKACTLMPSDGPDAIRKQMEDAIASFDDPTQVLTYGEAHLLIRQVLSSLVTRILGQS